jgi:hypothetical protein
MTGFDFATATFAIGVASLILIALNFRKMRLISFTLTLSTPSNEKMEKLPVGVIFMAINTSDNPIMPLYVEGKVFIGDKEIKSLQVPIELEKGATPHNVHLKYKNELESLGMISNPPTEEEIGQILQKKIRISVRCSYYRFRLMNKGFKKQEKKYCSIWDSMIDNWVRKI